MPDVPYVGLVGICEPHTHLPRCSSIVSRTSWPLGPNAHLQKVRVPITAQRDNIGGRAVSNITVDPRFAGVSVLPPEPERTNACAITHQDFLLLLEGNGSSRLASARDIAIGTFISALFGLISLDTAIPDWSKASSSNVVCLTALMAVTFASASLAVTFFVMTTRDHGRESVQLCKNRIEKALKNRGATPLPALTPPPLTPPPLTLPPLTPPPLTLPPMMPLTDSPPTDSTTDV